MAVDRRVQWFAGAAGIVIVGMLMWPSDEPEAPAPAQARPRGRPGVRDAAPASMERPPDVNLEALAAMRGEPTEQGRNPFRFFAKAPPPPPKTFTPVNQSAIGPVGPPQPAMPVGPPPPPAIPLKFIGILRKGGQSWAVLSDGQEPVFGTEGADIMGRYRILKIGQESLEISYLDGRGRTTLRLTGQ
jgi:hypothetical protein